jgi:hypothetical protein
MFRPAGRRALPVNHVSGWRVKMPPPSRRCRSQEVTVSIRTREIAALAIGAALVLGGCGSGGQPGPSPAASAPAVSTAPSTPAVQHHTASATVLAARLRAAGLPVRHLIVYTPVTDPNHLMGRQGGYTSKVAWQDPRAIKAGAGSPSSDPGGTEFGGGTDVFSTAADAQARYQYLRGFQAPFGDGYDYLSGTAILRLSQYLTPAQARAYKAAFTAAAGG